MRRKVALCVAEKPTVAKSVAEFLSRGRFNKLSSISKYNPIFEFDYFIRNEPYLLRVTSVLGHIMQHKFPDTCKNWQTTDLEQLYSVQLEKYVQENSLPVVKNIQKLSKDVDELILWLDCDREGEAIAFDVIDACTSTNRRLKILRAHFSALTREDIEGAIQDLQRPNQNLSDAVRVRQEIDLRIGASFTRLQTLNFREILLGNNFGNNVLSYGPCQFPTLGFIVERYKQMRDFVPEKFWYITLTYKKKGQGKDAKVEEVKFEWSRQRLFDKMACVIIFEKCQDAMIARITDVNKSKKVRARPQPLNTIEAQKLISRKLKIASANAMDIMEKLYQRGILSYPRTETNTFNPTINLRKIVDELTKNDELGDFASRVASGNMWGGPKNGKQDDKAHPPIHPVKNANKSDMSFDEWRVYELIARHFLACISKDAIGSETKIEADIGGEHFQTKGLIIEEQNWLEVFPYEKWSDTYLPQINKGEEFAPVLSIQDGETKAPSPLTEADLISKMDQNGIGTDATIHEHIKTVQERNYAYKQNQSFLPTPVGVNLVEAYENLGIELYKPYLRAQMENDMKLIAQGQKSKEAVLRDCINEMLRIFRRVRQCQDQMRQFLIDRMRAQGLRPGLNNLLGQNTNPSGGDGPDGGEGGAQISSQPRLLTDQFSNTEFAQCPSCKKSNMKIKTSKAGSLFIACMGFPTCKTTLSLPKGLENVQMVDECCESCMKRDRKKVNKFRLEFVTDFVNEAMTEVLPDDDNTSGLFCVMPNCDARYKTLLDVTFGLQNKRTYDTAFKANPNGVPGYYHQRPQNVPQGGGFVGEKGNKRRKMNENVGGGKTAQYKPDENKNARNMGENSERAGCPVCGKKRHLKNSECPNNKNKGK